MKNNPIRYDLNQDSENLSKQLDAMNRLYEISTLFIQKDNWSQILTKIVETAIAISNADFGNIQLLDDKSSLNIVAHYGFPKWWLDFWKEVNKGKGVCGTALETGERVIVEDVEQSPIFIGTPALDIQLKAGVHAVQSTPIVSRDGKPLGMFSTHFKKPHRPDDHELRLLDLLANQVADIIERKKAEDLNQHILKELGTTETLLSEITNLSSDVIYIKDRESRWIFTNPALERIIGKTADELLGKTDLEIYSNPEIGKIILDNDNRIMDSGKEETLEEVIETSEGMRSFISVKTPRFNDNGQVIGIVGISHDITERKKAENKLKLSEKKYHSLYSSMNEGVALHEIIYNPQHEAVDYVVTDINPAYETIVGLRQNEVVGKKASELYGTGKSPYIEIYANVAEKDEPIEFETFFEPMNKYFRISVISPEKGKFATIFENITERKKVEKELNKYQNELEYLVERRTLELENSYKSLKESEEHYMTLFNSIDEGFCTIEVIFDSNNNPIDYRFLEINPAFEMQTGLDNAEGKLMRDLAPDHEEYWFEIYGKIAVSGKPMRFVNQAKALKRWYDVYAFKVGSPESRVVAILFNDITKFKKLEKELRDHRDTLEEQVKIRTEALTESNKELEQFAYITSHDLREPLRMITSFLQLLERRYKDQLDQDANEFIGFAVDGAKRLDTMTNDLLQYSRISSQKREFAPVNFEQVLEEALKNLKVQIEENNTIITHDPLPTINGDGQLKVQLFQNIIGNAIKYRSQETPKIHISAKKEKNQYLFSINDNGIGISSEHLNRIFTIFQRLHTHGEYEGTGIGLAIAQKIVHQQGGEIWAESENGKGSTFYFTIPTN